MRPKLCSISPTILRFGITIRERSVCVSVVLNREMVTTWPSSLAMEIHSPTRNGLGKMIERPATTLLKTPWVAKGIPAPATHVPQTAEGTKAQPGPRHSQAGQQRQQLNAEVLQREHQEQGKGQN